jgi:hypothetical protein
MGRICAGPGSRSAKDSLSHFSGAPMRVSPSTSTLEADGAIVYRQVLVPVAVL